MDLCSMPKPPNRSPREPASPSEVVADPHLDRRVRRTFSAADKLRILDEVERCGERGELAVLLRREGIYSSHITAWREQLERHGTASFEPKKPGPKPKQDAKDRQIAALERKSEKLARELELARKLIDLQIKAHEIFGIALPRVEDE